MDFLFLRKHKKAKEIPLILFLLCFLFLAVFKSPNVGIDSKTYESQYSTIIDESLSSVFKAHRFEFGFYGLFYLFSKMGIPFLLFKALCYCLETVFLFLAFRKLDDNIFSIAIFMFLGFLSFSFSALRQGISISILSFAFSMFATKSRTTKWKKLRFILFPILVITATLFHSSSAVALILFPLTFIKIKHDRSLVCFMLFLPFAPWVFSALLSSYGPLTGYDYVVYTSRVSFRLILFSFVLLLFFALQASPFLKKIKLDRFITPIRPTRQDSIMFFVLYFCLVFASFNSFSQILARLSFFFLFGVGYFVGRETSAISEKRLRVVVELLAFAAVGFYFLIDAKTLGIYPYEFVF